MTVNNQYIKLNIAVLGPVSTLENTLLSGIFGNVTSAVGMTVDIIRNRQTNKSDFNN